MMGINSVSNGATQFNHGNSASRIAGTAVWQGPRLHSPRRGSGATERPGTKGPATEFTYLGVWTGMIHLMNHLRFWTAT